MKQLIKKWIYISSPGFSLIEVAIALAVMGIVISFTIPPLLNIMQIGRMKTTEHHQHAILVALANYAARYGSLPCPCPKISDLGVAAEKCNGFNEIQGFVPYKTLGIEQSYALDGYKKPFIYAINYKSSPSVQDKNLSPLVRFCTRRPDTIALDVKDYNNTSVFFDMLKQPKPLINRLDTKFFQQNPDEFDYLAVVLVSHDPTHVDRHRGKSIDIKLTEFKDYASLDYPYRVKWVSRDFLMGYYGNISCPKAALDNDHSKKGH